MTTVNAPYSKKLNAQELVRCLLDPVAAQGLPGHVGSFFGDVSPDMQKWFANAHNISEDQLVCSAKAFAEFARASFPLAV